MKTLNRFMTNIVSAKLPESKSFYTALFDFRIDYDSDWFVHLISAKHNLELGIIAPGSEIVPEGLSDQPAGFYITFVVEDADQVYEIARNENMEILQSPADTFYGQRRMLLKDPSGVIVDVSSPIKDFKFEG